MDTTKIKRILTNPVALILLSGLAVRLIIAPFFSDYNDFPYWAGIAFDVMTDEGIYRGYDLWYPPLWGYAVSLMTPIMDLFGITPLETIVDESSDIGYSLGNGQIVSPIVVFIIKIPLIVSDVCCGYLIYIIVRRLTEDVKKQISALLLWTFCPITIFVSAVQGQIDPLVTLLLLLSVWSYLSGNYFSSGAFIAASVLTKPFTSLAVLPMMALVWVYRTGRDNKIRSTSAYLLGGILMSFLILLPQIINGEMSFVTGFITNRYTSSPPLPADYTMSIYNDIGLETLYPQVSNLNTFFFLSFILSLILTIYVFAKGKVTDKGAILILTAAVSCHLMWYPATGYIQYYVPAVAMAVLCMTFDRRFRYLIYAIAVLTIIPALHGFSNFFQLYLLGLVPIDTLVDIRDWLWAVLDIPDGIASNLKFLPMLIIVILSMKMAKEDCDA